QRRVDFINQTLALLDVRWAVETYRVRLRVHVVLRPPDERVYVDRLDEGVCGQSSLLLRVLLELAHARVVLRVLEVPHLILRQQRPTRDEPASVVDLPTQALRFEQIEDGRR